MNEDSGAPVSRLQEREALSPLDALVREGARQMLQAALEAEVQAFLNEYQEATDVSGRRRVVRNGHLPGRVVLTGAGPLAVQQPRVRDRGMAKDDPARVRFQSAILPPYVRRSLSVDTLLPWLYLKGVSAGAMGEALAALLGPAAKGLSANVVVRLKEAWAREMAGWQGRDLSSKEYVYLWADGVYFNVRLDGERQCILVVIGATEDGRKELVAVQDGYRESEQSWRELLVDLKARGLRVAPKLAVGDGALGFWAALTRVFPETREQRCWVHKTVNVLDKLPKGTQARAKHDLQQIWMAETRGKAAAAFDTFIAKYGAKYPKAVACLVKDREVLLTFFDFPAEHWAHLRTTNPVESTFATVRLRHRRTKGSGSRAACLAMVFKLVQSAERHWRRLNGYHHLAEVRKGSRFVDGIIATRDAA